MAGSSGLIRISQLYVSPQLLPKSSRSYHELLLPTAGASDQLLLLEFTQMPTAAAANS
jgi:hypothetical protein